MKDIFISFLSSNGWLKILFFLSWKRKLPIFSILGSLFYLFQIIFQSTKCSSLSKNTIVERRLTKNDPDSIGRIEMRVNRCCQVNENIIYTDTFHHITSQHDYTPPYTLSYIYFIIWITLCSAERQNVKCAFQITHNWEQNERNPVELLAGIIIIQKFHKNKRMTLFGWRHGIYQNDP